MRPGESQTPLAQEGTMPGGGGSGYNIDTGALFAPENRRLPLERKMPRRRWFLQETQASLTRCGGEIVVIDDDVIVLEEVQHILRREFVL